MQDLTMKELLSYFLSAIKIRNRLYKYFKSLPYYKTRESWQVHEYKLAKLKTMIIKTLIKKNLTLQEYACIIKISYDALVEFIKYDISLTPQEYVTIMKLDKSRFYVGLFEEARQFYEVNKVYAELLHCLETRSETKTIKIAA